MVPIFAGRDRALLSPTEPGDHLIYQHAIIVRHSMSRGICNYTNYHEQLCAMNLARKEVIVAHKANLAHKGEIVAHKANLAHKDDIIALKI